MNSTFLVYRIEDWNEQVRAFRFIIEQCGTQGKEYIRYCPRCHMLWKGLPSHNHIDMFKIALGE